MTSFRVRGAASLAAILTGMATIPAQGANPGMKLGLAINDQFAGGGYYPSSDTYADRQPFPAIFVGFPLGRWRLAPTVSFLEKGGYGWYEVDSGSQGWPYRDNVYGSLWYISCQGDVHFTFPLGSADFYLLGAPRIDVLVSDGSPSSFGYRGDNAFYVPALSYEPVTVGLVLGLGQDISLGKDVLFFEFRYDRDLTPYLDASYEVYPGLGSTGPSWYNRMFMFQIGVRLNASRTRERSESTALWPHDRVGASSALLD